MNFTDLNLHKVTDEVSKFIDVNVRLDVLFLGIILRINLV